MPEKTPGTLAFPALSRVLEVVCDASRGTAIFLGLRRVGPAGLEASESLHYGTFFFSSSCTISIDSLAGLSARTDITYHPSQVNTVLQFGTLWLGLTNAVYLVPGDTVFSALW